MDLFKAIQTGNIESVRKYITEGKTVDITNSSGYTAINFAAILNQKEIFNLLLAHGAKTDFFTEVTCGNQDKVEDYINNGYDVNTTFVHGITPLMMAAHQGHTEIVRFLISKNADLNSRHYVSGNTPLLGAISQDQTEAACVLIMENADINLANNDNKTPLELAQTQNNQEIITLLLKTGVK